MAKSCIGNRALGEAKDRAGFGSAGVCSAVPLEAERTALHWPVQGFSRAGRRTAPVAGRAVLMPIRWTSLSECTLTMTGVFVGDSHP
jgi:hypothetical protein